MCATMMAIQFNQALKINEGSRYKILSQGLSTLPCLKYRKHRQTTDHIDGRCRKLGIRRIDDRRRQVKGAVTGSATVVAS